MPGSGRPSRPAEPDAVADAIVGFYTSYDEAARLGRDIGPPELAHTQELYRRCLPEPPAVVCDVGGGTGPYAFWLAREGYTVDLVDIVPRHVQQAQAHQDTLGAGRLRSLCVGDARRLDFPNGHADAVLLNGPLYHLVALDDRLAALGEARRVLRPGGILLAVAISRYAGAIAGLVTARVWDPVFLERCRSEITTGVRHIPVDARAQQPDRAIDTAYFHQPDELAREARSAGFDVVDLLGILGLSWMVPDLEASFRDPDRRERILELARLFEREPALGPRILAVCRARH